MKKRADGRYQKKISLGYDDDGHRLQTFVYGKTRAEVTQKYEDLLIEKGMGLDLTEAGTTLEMWSRIFLQEQKYCLSPSLYTTKESRIRYLNEQLGKNTRAKDIKPYHITPIIQELSLNNPKTHKASSKKTVVEYRNAWIQLFDFIHENGGIVNNPVNTTKIPKTAAPPKKRRALSVKEREWITNLPDDMFPAKAMAMLGMWAGLRRGEITALTWDDVDFENKIIRVNKSWDFKQKQVKDPKSERGFRAVPMFDILATYLLKVKHDCIEDIKQGNKQVGTEMWVCGDVHGHHHWRKQLSEILSYFEKEHGNPDVIPHAYGEKYVVWLTIQEFGWHDLRHTFATMLYENDCPLLEAASILGHDANMTMNIYTHLSKEQKLKTFDVLQEKFSKINS